MSRPTTNQGLTRLLNEWSVRSGESLVGLDLASKCRTSPRAIHYYTTGRKACPHLEAKIAAVFEISVPELRRRLGLSAPSIAGRSQPIKRKGKEQ